MKIGFDFDKVFIDYPPFVPAGIVDRFYKKKTKGHLLYRIPSKPEQEFRKLTHLPQLRPVMQENLSFLKRIPKEKHSLYLVSSRFGFLKQRTNAVVKKHGFDRLFDSLFFNFENKQPHLFKSEILRNLQLDMYVDDDLPLLRYVARHNKKTHFYWLNPTKTGHISHNITGITKLSDILPTIPTKAK